jgi:hypothetical protein
MKITSRIALLFAFLALFAVSCKEVTQAIDNLLTFDIDESSDIPITPLIPPEGILFPLPGIPIPIDSTTLAQHKTAFHLLKTLKLTKLKFTPNDPTYSMQNIDTLSISVGTDSLSTKLLATYSGSQDKVTLTNADFAAEAKNSNGKFYVVFKVKKSPSHDVDIKTDYTLTFTADPLP